MQAAHNGPSLAAIFSAHPASPAPATPPPPDELEEALRGALHAGRLAWPAIDVPAEGFVGHLAARLAPTQRTASAIRALHAADLYLVCACVRSNPQAIASFEARYFPEIDRALLRMRLSPAAVDDVKGELRERLLFPRGGGPTPLASYSGRGSVGAWLRLVAVRAAIKALRGGPKDAPALDELDVAVPGDDPELSHLKSTFAAEFKSALAQSIDALTVRERNLLRQSILDGLSVDQLGGLYRVHRATAARWVADVRGRLLDEVRRRLMARLRLDEAELESVMRLARSQLDVSVHRLLRPAKKKGRGI